MTFAIDQSVGVMFTTIKKLSSYWLLPLDTVTPPSMEDKSWDRAAQPFFRINGRSDFMVHGFGLKGYLSDKN